jgi:hypothetical protein
MRFGLSALAITAAVGVALLGSPAPAHATVVTYTTSGTFDSGDTMGTNVYTDAAHGISISYDPIVSNSVNANPSSNASFGTFNTSLTTATTLQGVSSGFTLDIFQTAPTPGGPLTFVGTLAGTLDINESHAYVQFNAPLSGNIGAVTYTITSADSGFAGRTALVPSTTNGGLATVQGLISVSAVPEPSVVLLAGLGVPALLLACRRHKKGNAAA